MKHAIPVLITALILLGAACTKAPSRDEPLAKGVVHLVKQRVPALVPQIQWASAGGGGGGTHDGVGEYAWSYTIETVAPEPVPEAATADLLGRVQSEIIAWLESEKVEVKATGKSSSGDQLYGFRMKYRAADELGWVVAWGHHAGGEYTLFLSVTARRD